MKGPDLSPLAGGKFKVTVLFDDDGVLLRHPERLPFTYEAHPRGDSVLLRDPEGNEVEIVDAFDFTPSPSTSLGPTIHRIRGNQSNGARQTVLLMEV